MLRLRIRRIRNHLVDGHLSAAITRAALVIVSDFDADLILDMSNKRLGRFLKGEIRRLGKMRRLRVRYRFPNV
jgi:hypothetical protein